MPKLPDDIAENYSSRQQSASVAATPTQIGAPGMGDMPTVDPKAPSGTPTAEEVDQADELYDGHADDKLLKSAERYRMKLIAAAEREYDKS